MDPKIPAGLRRNRVPVQPKYASEAKIVAQFDTLGRTLGYHRVPVPEVYKFLSWAPRGDTLHTLLGGAGTYAYVRIGTDRVLSIEPLGKSDIPGQPTAGAELQLESIAVLASGKPILSGEWVFQGDIPNQFLWNAFVIQSGEPLPVTLGGVKGTAGAGRYDATGKRDLLGRLVVSNKGLGRSSP